MNGAHVFGFDIFTLVWQNEMEHPWGEMHTAAKTTEEATRRLAVCNLDWDRVTAMDLFGKT